MSTDEVRKISTGTVYDELQSKGWYSDVGLSFIATVLSTGSGIVSAYACYAGNLEKLGPYDLNGDYCGSKVVGEDRKFLYYPDPYNPHFPVCMDRCPTSEWQSTINLPNGKGGISIHPVTAAELVQGQYCLQSRINIRNVIEALHTQQPFLYGIVQDVFKSTEVLFAVIFLSIIISVFLTKILLVKRVARSLSIACAIAPLFFILAIIMLAIFELSVDRILKPGFILFLVSLILIACCFGCLMIPLTFPKSFARSRQFSLIGIQALSEMPDLMTAVILIAASLAVTLVWYLWICAAVLTIGRSTPLALKVEANNESYIGLTTAFERTPGQGIACLAMCISFVVQLEAGIAFVKYTATRCGKVWFERLPLRGCRRPRCDGFLSALWHFPSKGKNMGSVSFFAPACRLPSQFYQMLETEKCLADNPETLATYIQKKIKAYADCVLFSNQLMHFKLDEKEQGFLEGALAGYMEAIQGKIDDHQAGKKYSVNEAISPAFQFALFGMMTIIVTVGTWICLEMAPIFNEKGLKALDSIPLVVLYALIVSGVVFEIMREAVNAAACCALMIWAKSSSDILWSGDINSDTLRCYESWTLKDFIDSLRRSSQQ